MALNELWTLSKELLTLASFLTPLLDKLTDAVIDAGLNGISSISRIFGVESELEKLKRTVTRIDALLKDAEETRFVNDESVRLWLADLKNVAFDADDLLDEFHTRIHISKIRNPSRKRKRPWDFLSRSWRIANEISEIRERYDEIAEDRNKLHLRDGDAKRRVRETEEQNFGSGSRQATLQILGMECKKMEIIEMLRSNSGDRVSVVSIVGVGGVGKTTLARFVFNDSDVVKIFPMRIWVGLSQGFDAKKTTKAIVESITGEGCNLSSLELLQRRLHQLVSRNKLLLVLDGVWNEKLSFWETLRAPLMSGGEGSKVLVITRSELVSRYMHTLPPIRLTGLGEEDCWLLFRDYAFVPGAWDQYPDLVEIGREIVRKCQGSPLAAKSIGGLLYLNTDEEEWSSVLNDMPDLEEDDANNVLPTLKVSYDHLPLHLKQCFAFCSIFPSGYEFDRDELVKLWMAVGFVKPRGRRPVENIGGKYFDYLLWRSFFQNSDGYSKIKQKYKMSGIIRELAQFVSRHECLRVENDVVHGEAENARYALLCHQDLETFDKIYENKRLRTFILHGEIGVPTKRVPNDLFLNLRCLRVLDLSNNELVVLPDSIGDLIHLRYLNLHSTKIERLPESVSNLYNLQTLELGECDKLLELPKGTSSLVNLRHLGLHLDWVRHRSGRADLISMPPGIGRLTSLRTLSRFSVSSESGCGIGELKNLNLRGELCISKLENVLDVEYVKEANLMNKQYLDTMMLRWTVCSCSSSQSGEFQEEVIRHLQPHTKLKYLWVENYNGKSFPGWMEDPSFLHLETLRLSNCRKCDVLPLLGKLPRLKNLHIEGLHEVKSMGHVISGNGGVVGFPFLEMLSLSDMPNLERWYEVEEGQMTRLTKLVMSDCSKLSELPHLPNSLQKFEIRNCKRLSALPVLQSLRDLVVLGGTGIIIRSIRQLISLSSLTISQFSHLKSLPKSNLQHLTSLRELKIEGCNKLVSVAQNEGLQDLSSLESLEISSCPELSSFAEEGLPATLKEFRLRFCNKLMSLPRGLHLLSSLHCMKIENIPMLTSLPAEGMPNGLKYLTIIGCPTLQQRCQRDGADWLKIQNVPYLEIGDSQNSIP